MAVQHGRCRWRGRSRSAPSQAATGPLPSCSSTSSNGFSKTCDEQCQREYPYQVTRDAPGWNGCRHWEPTTRRQFLNTAAAGAAAVGIGAGLHLGSSRASARPTGDPRQGLLANYGLEGTPVKGVFFFPGDPFDQNVWTVHPDDDLHLRWNTDKVSRARVLAQMAERHVNTVVASWWNTARWSPMVLTPADDPKSKSWMWLVDAAYQRLKPGQSPLVIMPAIESGTLRDGTGWSFKDGFPRDISGLVERIGWICEMFAQENPDRPYGTVGGYGLWAELYDRTGRPRHAINIIHAHSESARSDEEFADGFDRVAEAIRRKWGVEVGFTLDTRPGANYDPYPRSAGPVLAATNSVLAIHGFLSEVHSGLVHTKDDGYDGDNNRDYNIAAMADWKRRAMNDWIDSGPPVILDVANGYDARFVWSEQKWRWGDTLDYTDDRWRNWMSQLKSPNIVGICVDSWNGYTEGMATVRSREHGATVDNWLKDLLEPDPRHFSHMHYVNGAATYRVYGAICEKWIQLGADRFFGPPVSGEEPAGSGRKQEFADRKTIYWGPRTGAFEVHGLIASTYRAFGGPASCLGFPISDEQRWKVPWGGGGTISYFENGQITWQYGTSTAVVRDRRGGYEVCR